MSKTEGKLVDKTVINSPIYQPAHPVSISKCIALKVHHTLSRHGNATHASQPTPP